MNKSVSRYEQYWQLLKKHRGEVLELQVPDEFHIRVMVALKRRKTREHNATINLYPDFVFTRNPLDADGIPREDVLQVKLPKNAIDLI